MTKEKTSMVQRPSIKQQRMRTMIEKLNLIKKNIDTLESSGLKKSQSCKDAVKEYNATLIDIAKLDREDREDRRDCVAHLLWCFTAADYLCDVVECLDKQLLKVYGNINYVEGDFGDALRKTAKVLADMVVMVDLPKDERFSNNYADMSEDLADIMEDAKGKAFARLKEWQDSKGGNQLTFKGTREFEQRKQSNKRKR